MSELDIAQAKPRAAFNQLLIASVFSSAAASVCCLVPFVLLATGIGGTWVQMLMSVEPFQPVLAGLSVAFVLLAGRQLLLELSCCKGARPALSDLLGTGKALVYVAVLALVIILLSSEYWILLLFE